MRPQVHSRAGSGRDGTVAAMTEPREGWSAADRAVGLIEAPRLTAGEGLALLVERAEAGARVPAGWAELCGALAADLELIAPGFGVAQMKEKFGTLSVYVDLPDGYDGAEADVRRAVFDARVHAAERTSGAVCQECTRPGSLRRLGGWYVTCCANCARSLVAAGRTRALPRDARLRLDEAFPDVQLGSVAV